MIDYQGMAKIKVFVNNTDVDMDITAMTLAPLTFVWPAKTLLTLWWCCHGDADHTWTQSGSEL